MEIFGSDASFEDEDAECETVPISFDDEVGAADVSGTAATLFSAFEVYSISEVYKGATGKSAAASGALKNTSVLADVAFS